MSLDWDRPTPDEIEAWERHDAQDEAYDREDPDADEEYARDQEDET